MISATPSRDLPDDVPGEYRAEDEAMADMTFVAQECDELYRRSSPERLRGRAQLFSLTFEHIQSERQVCNADTCSVKLRHLENRTMV
jgi:hypothetical protein